MNQNEAHARQLDPAAWHPAAFRVPDEKLAFALQNRRLRSLTRARKELEQQNGNADPAFAAAAE